MGLDMYLNKKTYVKNWDHNPPERKIQISIKLGGKKHPAINPKKITDITEEVGYWRKANQIHQWFVDNVQNGEDNCKESYVEIEQLKTLLEICKTIKKSCELVDGEIMTNTDIAKKLLPTADGFFFGNTEYNQYYMQDIDNTIKMLEDEFSIVYPMGYYSMGYSPNYYYRASW